MRVFPPNRQRFVDLNILARFHATAAKNALIRIITVKRIRRINGIRFRFERDFLMFDGQQFGRVVDRAVAVVIVADGAVQHVIAENPVKGFPLCSHRAAGFCGDLHIGLDLGCARSHQRSIDLNHTRIAGLNRAKLWVITHLRDFGPRAVKKIHEAFFGLCLDGRTVNCHSHCHTLS